MNLWVKADPINPATYAQDVAARRRRLMGKPQPKVKTPVPAPVEVEPQPVLVPFRPRKAADLPTPRCQLQKDAQVIAYREWQVETLGQPCKAHIMARATEFGLTYADVVGTSRLRNISTARQQIMCSLREKYPNLTLPQIGRLFGRDHTTVLHALVKFGHKTSSRATVSPEMSEEMKRLHADGVTRAEIASQFGVSTSTVIAHIDPARYRRDMDAKATRTKAARLRKRGMCP